VWRDSWKVADNKISKKECCIVNSFVLIMQYCFDLPMADRCYSVE
jgi:hypothetical protein